MARVMQNRDDWDVSFFLYIEKNKGVKEYKEWAGGFRPKPGNTQKTPLAESEAGKTPKNIVPLKTSQGPVEPWRGPEPVAGPGSNAWTGPGDWDISAEEAKRRSAVMDAELKAGREWHAMIDRRDAEAPPKPKPKSQQGSKQDEIHWS